MILCYHTKPLVYVVCYTGLYSEEAVVDEPQGPRASLAAAALALEPPVAVQHALSLILLALHITQVIYFYTVYVITTDTYR